MVGYREYFVVAEYKENCSLKPGQEVINIEEIQPLETHLINNHVEFFLDDPSRIFSRENGIRLIFKDGMLFKCFVQDGSHRLYVLNKLGIKKLVIERVENYWREDCSVFLESVMEAFELGVRNWEQLQVVEEEELYAVYSMREEESK